MDPRAKYVKFKTRKLPEGNIGDNLDDLGQNQDILNTAPKAHPMKAIIDHLNFIKAKNF